MFHQLGGLAVRWPKLVLALSVAAVVGLAVYGSGIGAQLKPNEGFVVEGSESDKVARQLDDTFGASNSSAVVLFETRGGGSIQAPEAARELGRLLAPLAADKLVTAAPDGTARTASLVSRDGRQAFVVISSDLSGGKLTERLASWQSGATSEVLTTKLGGSAVAQQQSSERVEVDLKRAELFSLPILAVLLVIMFGSLVAASLPLALGVVAILGGLAVARVLAGLTTVDQYAVNVITILGLGLSIDYSLLMVSRFREELKLLPHGEGHAAAVRRTVQTAGRTIFFSALTVVASLLVLLLFPIGFLHSIALGSASAILMAGLAALVVLPALLMLLGHKVNRLRVIRTRPRPAGHQGVWHRLGALVVRRPWWAMIASVGIICALAYPLTQAKFVTQDYRFLPVGTSSREVAEALSKNFVSNGSQAELIVNLGSETAAGNNGLTGVRSQILAVPGVTGVSEPKTSGSLAHFTVSMVADDGAARATVHDLRQITVANGTVQVGGQVAALDDTLNVLAARAPWAGLIIAVSMFVLLGLLVRSVTVPLQAIVINSFALLAAIGLLVFVFQQGHTGPFTWFSPTGGLDPTIPVLIAAIAFGLSMDYAAFLYSRVREEHDHGREAREAIITSLGQTGGIITAAAILLVVVIASFAASTSALIQQIGLGLSAAVFLDAFVVRLLLVPAVMSQLGRLNWVAPKWLSRIKIES